MQLSRACRPQRYSSVMTTKTVAKRRKTVFLTRICFLYSPVQNFTTATRRWQIRLGRCAIDLGHSEGTTVVRQQLTEQLSTIPQLCGAQGSSLKEKVTSNHTQVQKRLTSSRTMATSSDSAPAAKLDDATKQRCLNLARTLSDHAQLPAHCQVN